MNDENTYFTIEVSLDVDSKNIAHIRWGNISKNSLNVVVGDIEFNLVLDIIEHYFESRCVDDILKVSGYYHIAVSLDIFAPTNYYLDYDFVESFKSRDRRKKLKKILQ